MEATRANQAYCVLKVLYMALELSVKKWVVLFSDGVRRRQVTVDAGDRTALLAQIGLAKARLKLAPHTPVVSCYEAGRDGFWLHRWLASVGVDNCVVDPASIEVPQHAKRVKTDRVDVHKLMDLLVRWHGATSQTAHAAVRGGRAKWLALERRDLRLARDPQPPPARRAGGLHAHALREWAKPTRAGHQQGRQRACAQGDDRAGVAVAAL